MVERPKEKQTKEGTFYPPNVLELRKDLDVIYPKDASTVAALFRERVRRTPAKTAYREYERATDEWRKYSWKDVASIVARWQAALEKEDLKKGDRVAVKLKNCLHWVIFDQAAAGLGLVTVPIFADDRPSNVSYIINHSDSKVLLLDSEDRWHELYGVRGDLYTLQRIIILGDVKDPGDARVISAGKWLPQEIGVIRANESAPDELVTIMYTSGTTGPPKGVMLSNTNIVSNSFMCLQSLAIFPTDVFLSFLPLSHSFERTTGYYLPIMSGSEVAFARSIMELAADFKTVCPTFLISVPRIFEMVHSGIMKKVGSGSALKRALFNATLRVGWNRFLRQQKRGRWRFSLLFWPILNGLVARKIRAALGGRLRSTAIGAAPLAPAVSKLFLSLGIEMLHGYGLTESTPVISVNTSQCNVPESIGPPLHGVEVKIGANDELLSRGSHIMMGYWKDEKATEDAIDSDGWLYTGDQAKIVDGYLYITGRLKDIIVLSNGEKMPPNDMETSILKDPLFDQVMVLGEGMPYLTALVVLNKEFWNEKAGEFSIDPQDEEALKSSEIENRLIERISSHIQQFPGYAKIRHVSAFLEPWTLDNGLMTPTMKLKRGPINERFSKEIEMMYADHVNKSQGK